MPRRWAALTGPCQRRSACCWRSPTASIVTLEDLLAPGALPVAEVHDALDGRRRAAVEVAGLLGDGDHVPQAGHVHAAVGGDRPGALFEVERPVALGDVLGR